MPYFPRFPCYILSSRLYKYKKKGRIKYLLMGSICKDIAIKNSYNVVVYRYIISLINRVTQEERKIYGQKETEFET